MLPLSNPDSIFLPKKITVNLAPADLPKESGRFDLPIAIGVLAASGQIDAADLAKYEFAGELALSGVLRPIRGGLAMAWQAQQACRRFVLPSENAVQAAIMKKYRSIWSRQFRGSGCTFEQCYTAAADCGRCTASNG